MNAVVDTRVRPEALDYLASFAEDPGEPEWLVGVRQRGLASFSELGWPSRRSEGWRYIDLRPIDQMRPVEAPAAAASRVTRKRLEKLAFGEAGQRIVLVNGHFEPELSAIEPAPGIWFGSMAAAIRERPDLVQSALTADEEGEGRAVAGLNAAFFTDGFVLEVAPGVVLEHPVEIVHLTADIAGVSLHTRSLIALGAGSRASLIEAYAGEGRYWRNDAVVLRLAASAALDRIVLVEEAADCVHLGEIAATLDRGAHFTNFALLLGGGTARQEATVRMAGEGARVRLDGAFAISGRQQANIVTTVDHRASGGETRELVKGVASGRAHGAFQGRIIVRPGAQKTDAQQTSRNLLLGSRAVIDTKPELEIYADDVKCSHGATVGDLDDAAMFYLQARGIPHAEARRMLIDAFLREAVETVAHAGLREHLLRCLARRLSVLED